jgi:hypothetical protein
MSSAAVSKTEPRQPMPEPEHRIQFPAMSRADRMQDRLKGTVRVVGDIVSPFPELDLERDRD